MTPDDWKAGMENEAKSVEDALWSNDTRRAARLLLRPLAHQITVYGLCLMALGFINTLLVENVLRFSVLQQYNPLGEWLMNEVRFPGMIEVTHLLPALVATGLASMRFTPLTLMTLGALAFVPMDTGAWLYTQTHHSLSYSTQTGVEQIHVAGYTGFTAPFSVAQSVLCIGLGAYLGRGIRTVLLRKLA